MKNFLTLLLFSLFFSCFSEPKKKNENPSKTEKKVPKIENGTYYKEGDEEGGELIINTSISENDKINLNFEILSWYKKNGTTLCSGFLEGKIISYSNQKGIYNDEECEKLKFEYLGNSKIEISESNCYYHGMNCYFSGIYKKK
ncbi:hypothetical protein [Tenacibaculum finnmarkense]|uniref:hypothetical protein n=1 Tax=Tenacibaculum finnmarkense TaxID=2781243 RepID=UPI001EFBE054|nr:hypothetical protein [Tenacibaculum finnmarkense]MCG8803972.1 hypothetical protein [Tenacibaculum finnmarkense]MCG8826705.1 hypothetical protein [Tenacibaculum finnmarkense]